jgi:hypothetical protein
MATHEEHPEGSVPEDELEEQEGEPLPDREVMTILPIDPTAASKVPLPPLDPS